MTRFLLLIAAVGLGLSSPLLTDSGRVQAQVARTDTIRFMAATRGFDYENPISGFREWCYTNYWHQSWSNPSSALDEVAQYQAPPRTQDSCHSNSDEKVDLATFGFTNVSSCTESSPCQSLWAGGTSGTYQDGCEVIEVDLYDYLTWDDNAKSGDWKGKQRMLHTLAPNSSWTYFELPPIPVTSTGRYNRTEIGTVQNDTGCLNGTGFQDQGYHVHHDFMPPTVSPNCAWGRNDDPSSGLGQRDTDWQKENPNHWVHFLVHSLGVACVVPGPDAANWLLRSGGELDDTGAGMRALATTGTPVSIAYTCFTQSNWCGTETVAKELAVAAYRRYQGISPVDYFNAQQRRFPPSGDSADNYWYNNGGYYFNVKYAWAPPSGGTDSCGGSRNAYEAVYSVYYYGSVGIGCVQNWMNPGAANLSAPGVANA